MKPHVSTTWFAMGMILLFSTVSGVVPAMAQMMGGMEREKARGMEEKMGMEGPRGESYGEGPFDIDAMKERLGLTDDQVMKLKKIRLDYRKEMIRRGANLRVAELEQWELMDTTNLEMEKVEKKVRELEAMRADLMLYRVKVLQETRKFLSEKQYEQFREMGFKRMRSMMGRHGQGMMGGGMHEDQ